MVDTLYRNVLRSAFGLSMGAVWQHMTVELRELSRDGTDRVDAFFSLLERLMSAGDIKLARDGVFLVGSISEQLNVLRAVWPLEPSDDDLDGFWFLAEAPAGLVWIDSDGKEYWT
ncbi:DUF596 domain-containing protein [Pseudomonas solani]